MRVFKVFVLLGGMGVEMKGGMTGGMKIEESLYLKGSAPSDGRDGALFVKESTKIRTRQIFVNESRFFQHALLSKYSLTGN